MRGSAAGHVALVGAGPGDPGLLTLRAAEELRRADVLLYDALAGDEIVALAPERCERIFVGKRAGDHAMPQRDIEALMIREAAAGKRVVRLKGGDPFVFGRGGEEALALREAGVAFTIVPGISSAIAGPAYAGIPVSHRGISTAFTVATGHEEPGKTASTLDWEKLADPHRTLVLLMGTANLRGIAGELIAHGLPPATPAAAIENATQPEQRTTVGTLGSIADDVERDGIGAPATIVIGEVVRLRDRVAWFETSPLFGMRVLVTRAGPQSERFALTLRAYGARPVLAPTIAIGPPADPVPARQAIDELDAYAWIAFSSQNGVDAFFAALARRNYDARRLRAIRVAAVGERTAGALERRGVRPDVVPGEHVGERVAEAIARNASPGERVLVYGAQEARDAMPRMLRDAGLAVTAVAAYATFVPDDPEFAAKAARANVLTFTSASTVRGFVTLLGGQARAAEAARDKLVACIGPITAQAARDAGLHVDVVAGTYTTDALLDAIAAHRATRP